MEQQYYVLIADHHFGVVVYLASNLEVATQIKKSGLHWRRNWSLKIKTEGEIGKRIENYIIEQREGLDPLKAMTLSDVKHAEEYDEVWGNNYEHYEADMPDFMSEDEESKNLFDILGIGD